jgi:SHS2 domain-containing protein
VAVEARAAGKTGAAFAKHIKAATYHNLEIRQAEDGLETVVVFDV